MHARAEVDTAASSQGSPQTWVHSLTDVISRATHTSESRMRTMLSCDIGSGKPALFVPPDMAELQPKSLRFIKSIAQTNGFRLVEDRRRVEIRPVIEQRSSKPPTIALGLSMLLNQIGMPGPTRSLSTPHRLNSDSPHIGIAQLIKMAAFTEKESKRIVFLPNKMIVDVLDDDTQPIAGYACRLLTEDSSTVLSHFNSPYFRAIGYSTGAQYVIHVCFGGGLLGSPTIWTHLKTLTRTSFRFQLFPGHNPAQDFGLLYATFYMDVAQEPAPWWLGTPENSQALVKAS